MSPLKSLASTLILVVLPLNTYCLAHSGGTDANGCHTNRKTGEYHCHAGGKKSFDPTSNSLESYSGGRFIHESIGSRTNQAFSCMGKTQCGQMTSCAEAKYYLLNCGLYRLDGDGDGVPCESLCRY